jgi:hypothetical protein
MPFQYPATRGKKEKITPLGMVSVPNPEDDEEMGLIQGRKPGSREEWRVYKSLLKYKVEFQYQVSVWGGSQVLGGYLIDYVVFNPFPNALEVNGEYWHSAEMRPTERLKLNALTAMFNREPYVVWGKDLQTQEDCDRAIVAELGL